MDKIKRYLESSNYYNIVGYDDNTDLTEFYSDHNEIYEYDF